VEPDRAKSTVKPTPTDDREDHAAREVKLDLQAPAWEALDEEADRTGMTVAELVGFSVLYYLADRDSGRIARHLPITPAAPDTDADERHPLEKLLDD
jgi:hypothetical protein